MLLSTKIDGGIFMKLENIEKVCEEIGIILKPLPPWFLPEGMESVGVAYRLGETRVALYSPELERVQQLHVIAHEIGHHVLGHLSKERQISREVREIEADIFGAVFAAMAFHRKAAAV
jgi:hypothetical protein